MRTPAPVLVVDAAVLVAAAFGRSARSILEVQRRSVLVTTDRVVEEARRRIALGAKRPDLVSIVDRLVEHITVVSVEALAFLIDASELTLREAVASRNGSTRDAHVLALAWSVDADVWTTDRDFAGTGVATWSTPNLIRSLAQAPASGR
jgi:predicted nucleic acid-binding protein